MPKVLEKAKDYTVKAGDTLEDIVKNECPDLDWKTLARYNWGTDRAREVIRALSETVGVKVADLAKIGFLTNPQELKLAPDSELAPKLNIPKVWKKDGLELEKTHVIKVKRHQPANAISIIELDKWFIPEEEVCQIAYQLEGDGEFANTAQVDVFGSNYCDCTAWNKGLGTYGDPAALEDEPVFTQKLTDQAEERQHYGLLGEGWKGEVTTTKGLLRHKTGTAKERYINVAFSPYTVHFRYWKADGDKNARFIIEPFWPQWEETKTEPVVTTTVAADKVTVKWTNAAEVNRGVLLIKDKKGQRVHLEAVPDDKLSAGAKEQEWNKQYRADVINSKFGSVYLDDSAATDPDTGNPANENAPYTYNITTIVLKPKADTLKIKWKIKNSNSKLERGLLQITDGNDKLVFQKPLTKAKLGDGNDFKEFAWDGKYSEDIKNSKDGKEIIPEDMPYRVQIQAHTGIDQPEGLAIAAMHTEVRLYVHPKTFAPKDLMYDSWAAKPSLLLTKGSLVPGDPPAEADGTRWYQYKLAEYGFHPGPVTGSTNDHYKTALKEFKRSVPKQNTGTDYERLTIDENETDETKNAIKHIEAKYKRKLFGDLTKVLADNDDPDPSDDEIKRDLPDPEKDIIIWVDDRQYYTTGSAKDESNNDFFAGNLERVAFGLGGYRGGMEIADGRTTTDSTSIARPWIPLQVGLSLVSRAKGLSGEIDLPNAEDEKEKLLKTMRSAIGPLRIDWTFDELPPDVSTINAGSYDPKYTRTRRFVAWAIENNKATHNRLDTERATTYTNCTEDLGGIRPGALASYYAKAFGTGDFKLTPWEATAVAATEFVATVVHDHIDKEQKDKTKEPDATKVNLFESLIGTSGAYFNPSRIAGDGYRVRAEVQFDKFTGYDFPNLKTLKARYPTPPQAHSARLRIWRRSSIRGYMCWASAGTGHWPGHLAVFRAHYRAAHIYFVHEAGTAPQTFNIASVYNEGNNAHQTSYKNTINNNLTDLDLQGIGNMRLRSADIWPWGHKNDLGWWWRSDEGIAKADLYDDWLNDIIDATWRSFRDGLLLALIKQIEKSGFMRGHLFVEFDSSPRAFLERYKCGDGHVYWFLEKDATRWKANGPCPAPGCARTLRAKGDGKDYPDGLPLPAVGIALGATWLFTSSDADTWAHEIGHHRHLEHAASAPGAQYADRDLTDPPPNAELHDSQDNETQNWGALGVADASEQDWDRNCIMSYASGPGLYFCGKCLLRNRGWKVQGLGYPGKKIKEP